MKRVVLTVLLTACAVALALAGPAAAATPATPASRVVLVLAPYLTWDDIDPANSPTLARMADEGAVGNINVKNRNLDALLGNNTEQAALTFSSGAWAALPPGVPSAYRVDEPYEAGSAAEAYTRLMGEPPSGNDVVYLGMPRVQRASRLNLTLEVVPGTLGGEIVAAGGATAAIGNSDPGRDMEMPAYNRPAGIVAMDYTGRVRFGDVSSRLLRDDSFEPFGVATDLEAFGSSLTEVEQRLAEEAGPQLVVLDPGDLARVEAIAPFTLPDAADRQHARAVATLDQVVARAWETLPDDGLLLVLSPAGVEATDTVSGLSPALAVGRGMNGLLTSSSTQRPGLVTNLDVAATILDALDVAVPVQVLGNPMYSIAGPASREERIGALVQTNTTAIAVDTAKPAVVNTFIALTLFVLAASTFLLLRARRWRTRTVGVFAAVANMLLLGVLSVPPASLLMFIVDGTPETPAEAVVMFAVIVAALWAVALVIARYAPLRVAVASLSLLGAGLLLLDQWLGAPWSFTSFLGYSPILAARYYGIGNEGAAMLFGAMLVGVSFVFDQWPDSRVTRIARRWLLPLAGLLLVATCAAPFFGANVGVIAWGVVGFAVAWALMNGHRVSWKLATIALLAIVFLVGAFSLFDLFGSSGSQTHLGRAWESAGEGGAGELWLIVVRKAQTNLRVLTHTNWSFVLIGMLAFLGFMRWRPQGDFAATLDENPHFSAAMAACLLGGLAAYFTEDSGIVIPALIVLYVGAGILYLMLSRLKDTITAEETAAGGDAA